jgi:hypothetical protein
MAAAGLHIDDPLGRVADVLVLLWHQVPDCAVLGQAQLNEVSGALK